MSLVLLYLLYLVSYDLNKNGWLLCTLDLVVNQFLVTSLRVN
jgi:hypothetical protein